MVVYHAYDQIVELIAKLNPTKVMALKANEELQHRFEDLVTKSIGNATVKILNLNHPDSIIERHEMIRLNLIESLSPPLPHPLKLPLELITSHRLHRSNHIFRFIFTQKLSL